MKTNYRVTIKTSIINLGFHIIDVATPEQAIDRAVDDAIRQIGLDVDDIIDITVIPF